MIKIGLQWFINQIGDGVIVYLEVGGFIRSEFGVEYFNIQYYFFFLIVNDYGREVGDRYVYQVYVGFMRFISRGFFKLKFLDFKEYFRIVVNYFLIEQDIREMRDSIKLIREIFQQKAFDLYRGFELVLGVYV